MTGLLQGPLNDPNPKGSIWVYELDKPYDVSPHRLHLDGFPETSDFHPLGVDILPATRTEPAHVFIVNHGRNYSTVEQFTLVGRKEAPYHARYVRTWEHKAIHAPNAIVPLSPTSFYLTNDHRLTRRLPAPVGDIAPLVETLLAIPGGWVDRLDLVEGEVKVARAISNIPFANGIALSPDGTEVAVVSTTEATVQLYDRDPATSALTFRERIYIPHSPDNVSYDENKGSILVAGHPHFPSLIKLVAKKSQTSPSWVIEIERRNVSDGVPVDAEAPYPAYKRVAPTTNYKLTTVYQSNGLHYSTSATGIRHGKNLLVAGLYGDGLLHCAFLCIPRESTTCSQHLSRQINVISVETYSNKCSSP